MDIKEIIINTTSDSVIEELVIVKLSFLNQDKIEAYLVFSDNLSKNKQSIENINDLQSI
jgi:hypothetical protein